MSGRPGAAVTAEEQLAERIAEAHGLLRDLKTLVRDARAEREILTRVLADEVRPELHAQVDKIAAEIHTAMEKMTEGQQEIVDSVNDRLREVAGLADAEAAQRFLASELAAAIDPLVDARIDGYLENMQQTLLARIDQVLSQPATVAALAKGGAEFQLGRRSRRTPPGIRVPGRP